MSKYNADSVHKRVDYARYIYKNTDIYPTAFESLSYPIAAYGRDGVIVGANRYFREVARITAKEIQNGSVSFFDCLIENNAMLLEAAHNAFDGEEKVYEDIGPALRAEPGTAVYLQLADFPNAIFFPMAYDREGVKLAAVLLDSKEKEM